MELYFEDFPVGTEGESPARTITDADVLAFADLTADHSPQHLDDAYAAKTFFGRRVAHGALVFSVAMGLSTQIADRRPAVVAFFAIDELRFLRPVEPGDAVRVRKRVAAREEKDARRGLVSFETTVVNQHDQAVMSFIDRVLIRRRRESAPQP